MARIRQPRRGSMGIWPRKRARSEIVRVRSWQKNDSATALGLAGYKVGMTQAMIKDNRKTVKAKDLEMMIPITIIECPPIKVFGVRFYKKDGHIITSSLDIISKNVDKELKRRIVLSKKADTKKIEDINPADYCNIKLIVHTQPKMTGFGKKAPEVFEVGIGGNITQKFEYAKNILGKEIKVTDLFKPGDQADTHSVSKGKGLQGPVKRFGVSLRQHKSEKTKRGAGSLGPWHPSKATYNVSRSGQMGYHTRTQYNNWIVAIYEKGEELNVKGGFINYGIIKNPCIVFRGSVPGPKKRMIKIIKAIRRNKLIPSDAPEIIWMSKESPQGN